MKMGTQAGVGISHHRNPRVAGKEAVEQALAEAGIEKPDFTLVFASVGYHQQTLIESVREATGGAPLSGCSGEGVIAGQEADESNFSVGVMAISSDEMQFVHGMAPGLADDAEAVGHGVGEAVSPHARDDSIALLVFADAITFNFDRFLAGLESAATTDHPLPLFGGLSGDNWQLKQTYQYCDDEVASEAVAWALISGPLKAAWSISHGCVPVGVERKVTRAEGNVIYEIDDTPVLDVMKEYLVEKEIDDWQEAIVNLCLMFEAPGHLQDHAEYLIRFMPTKDDATGSVTIATEVKEGESVWMTRRDHRLIQEGVDRMAVSISDKLEGATPKLVLHFDCAGRGKSMFRDQVKTDLLTRLQKQIAPDAPWLGFFTYGEIGPVGDENCFHNYTAVVAAFA
jgi:hypothetical protein